MAEAAAEGPRAGHRLAVPGRRSAGVVAPLASVIVPSLNGAHLLPTCLDSLARQTYARVEVIVADGASTDATADLLARRYPSVRLLALQRNGGFAGNVNAGLRAARGEILLLLNNDAEAEPDWVGMCVETLVQHPELGSVASKVLFAAQRTINSAGDVARPRRRAAPARRRPGRRPAAGISPVRCSAPWAARPRFDALCSPTWGCSTRSFSCTSRTSIWPFARSCAGGAACTSRWRACTTRAARPAVDRWPPSTTDATCFGCSPRTCPAGVLPKAVAGHASVPGSAGCRGAQRLARRGGARHPARAARRAGRDAAPPGRSTRRSVAAARLGCHDLRPAERVSPALSLILPAYNEQARLPFTLGEINAYVCAERLDCEVIVVDNGSHDATSAVVQQAMQRFPALRLLRTDRRGKGLAVRTGMLAARGDVVAVRRRGPVVGRRRACRVLSPWSTIEPRS